MDEVIHDVEPEPKSRPAGVSIVAVLALIAGFFGVCLSPLSIGQMLVAKEPMYAAMRADATMYYVTVVGGAVGWFVSLGVIALGFGLWKLKEWARAGTVVYCIFAAVWAVVGGALNMIYITPKAMQIAFANTPSPNKIPAEMIKNIVLVSQITAVVLTLVMCGIYIFIAVYMAKPTVKDAFRREEH